MPTQEVTIKHDHEYLDTLTVGELEALLAKAEHAIHSVRMELRERRCPENEQLTDEQVSSLMPENNLTETVGSWRDFVQFLKDFTDEKK